ncbi:MAG: restriction endonuclease subunit S [Desulfobacter postgatei]|uniref:restriction endonuclease subunit S n=1 Tax=Desulfobacter postgatei TaxID=2293 RepID=UPI0023F20315|nr:restriction endonuclease subunit S [Desulfobacter postgatei]MDD4273139.1 restriction endonuclease subunit S [Desulfobacter postgatei]
MTETAKILPKAFAVRFAQVKRWDPNSFHDIEWHWPASVMAAIGSVLGPRKEKVDRSENGFNDLMPVTIHFDGSIEPRKVSEDKEYTMELFWAQPGDIVVSKIDLKNGAVAIIPDGWDKVVVTNHFAVYEPDLKKLDPRYFHLLIQAKFFKEHLWRNKVGAEGRKEVKLDFFESLEVPIPSLSIQQKIVAHLFTAQISVTDAKVRAAQIEKEIQARFLADLGLPRPKRSTPPKSFAANWQSFERWSVGYNQAIMSMIDLMEGKYPVVELGSILEMVQYGTSEKANTSEKGTPVLRMNNIKDGYLDYSNIKHVALPKKTRESLLLVDGDILFNRTNSKELVGKCAVFHSHDEYVFASYLIRVRPDKDRAISDFVVYCINSVIGRQQIDALSRQIIGQANINSQELRSLRLPLPPIDSQQEIMAHIERGRNEIVQQMETVTQLKSETQSEIEKMILGTLSVEEL